MATPTISKEQDKPTVERETPTQAQVVAETANVSATVPLTIQIDRDAYLYVASSLIKEEIGIWGAEKAKRLVPDKMARLLNEFVIGRAKQLAKQSAKRALELQFKDEIESNARERLAAIHRLNNEMK